MKTHPKHHLQDTKTTHHFYIIVIRHFACY